MSHFNDQDGLDYSGADAVTARLADLGTLPKNVVGTNCGNCQYSRHVPNRDVLLLCVHPEVQLTVTDRMCCCFWDAPGFKRS